RVVHRKSVSIVAALLSLVASACGGDGSPEENRTLHQKYADYFRIGAAVDARSYMTHSELLLREFNSITTENEMKFDALQPSEDNFRFSTADAIVDFALGAGMSMRG